MENLKTIWGNLTIQKRAILIASLVASFLGVFALTALATRTNYALLYANLDEASAGEIIAELEQSGVAYQIKGNSLYVADAKRDALRLELAAQGMPKAGPQGYELLDQLSGFGTTSQMFDATYLRAKEGELARTIQAIPEIEVARVHTSSGQRRGFQAQPTESASVAITTRGGPLSIGHADAIRFLVASAFPALTVENVSIVDTRFGLIDQPTTKSSVQIEDTLRQRAERLLAAHLGVGNSVVEVTAELISFAERTSERTIDPESRVAISTQEDEETSKSNEHGGEAVTVASNLPDGDAAAGQSTSSEDTKNRRTTNFEFSEMHREIERGPGDIKRLTVAVLINETDPTRTSAEIEALQDLVSNAIGLSDERGDKITIQSMAFAPPLSEELGQSGAALQNLNWSAIILASIVGLVLVGLGAFVIRPMVMAARLPPILPQAEVIAPPDTGPASVEPVAQLQDLIGHRKQDAVKLLQSWSQTSGEVRS